MTTNLSSPSSTPLTPALYVVATPIGNMEDITWRALRVLKNVDVIACEDTRETTKLLSFYNIKTPYLSYHSHSKLSKEEKIISLLQEGKSVALVSDRGTPGISDPGSRLITKAIKAGIKIVPIPGPCALITALQAAGADTSAFNYFGYLPHKKGRQTFLNRVLEQTSTVIFYESSHRIIKCLRQMIKLGIANRRIILGRELTKLHEQFLSGSAAELLEQIEKNNLAKGEFVVIADAKSHDNEGLR